MIRNYLLITWRSMMKNKFFITINIDGLAVAIACSIVACFNWEFDGGFPRQPIILFISSLPGSMASYFAVDWLMGNIWDYYQSATTLTFVAFDVFPLGNHHWVQGFLCGIHEPCQHLAG